MLPIGFHLQLEFTIIFRNKTLFTITITEKSRQTEGNRLRISNTTTIRSINDDDERKITLQRQ